MRKILLSILVLIFALNGFCQISFEEGYFIDNIGNKTECLIKNIDYSDITKSINYKLLEDAKTEVVNLNNIKEIVIYNTNKFIKQKVDIGKPNESNINDTDYTFNIEDLFLKVLVEGEASLYSYYMKGTETFFFSSNKLEIKQLVFKTWLSENNVKRENNGYKKQLFDNLLCETINFDTANNLKYQQKDLISFFIKYNDCKDSNMTVYNIEPKIFNVSLRPRMSFTKLILNERGSRINKRAHDFGNKTLFGLGVELEAILPFLNNKWAISLEPTYDSIYSSELIFDNDVNIGESVTVSYKSFNIPLTLRHYSYINTNSKFFANASIVFDFPSNSNTIKYIINENVITELSPKGSTNLAFGAGYKFKNKYSAEARYYTNRNIINNLIDYSTNYTQFSVILGYTIF